MRGIDARLRAIRQVLHIRRSFQLLAEERTRVVRAARERVRTGSATSEDLQREKADLQRLAAQEKSLKNDCWVQAGYLPLTAHWSVCALRLRIDIVSSMTDQLILFGRSIPGGVLPNNAWVGICGTVAAAAGLRGVWRRTA